MTIMKLKFFAVIFSCLSVVMLQAQTAFQVKVKGKGQPVLLFPGFACTGEVWDDIVAELAKKYQCHVFTFAGFGQVPPISTPWLSTIKNEVLDYVKTKKLDHPTLIGHSLGGTLSLWLAATETKLFKKVIAVDALPSTAALMIPNYKGDSLAYDNPQSNKLLNMDSAALHKMNEQQALFMCRNVAKRSTIVQWMNQADRKTYTYGYIDLMNLDLRQSIANITIPVVVLAATNPNKAMAEKTMAKQYEQLPGTIFHYADNSAHFIMYDQPSWLLEKIKENLY
jgi:pimeloyl-ACP methyl ester carboxylesterase